MNSTLRIELDGTLITGRVDGIDNFVVTKRRDDESGKIASSFTSELTFYDDGYQIIKSKLIGQSIASTQYVDVIIYDDYCGQPVFNGKIQYDEIDWCEPGCYVTANIIEQDPIISCIQNTIIWDDKNGFLQQNYTGVEYCLQLRPFFIHVLFGYVLGILRLIVDFVVIILIPFITVIWGFCLFIQLLCRIFGINGPDCNQGINNPGVYWDNVVVAADGIFDQCGHKHPTPFVRDYINNVCSICGLTFESSILNDPNSNYYNLGLLAAQVEKGKNQNSDNKLITDNLPVETLQTLMDSYLKPLFNADYRVINNKLIFERKDYFFNSNNLWIDVDNLINRGLVEDNVVCYSWIDKEKYAYGDYRYSMDASDYIGNEVRRRWEDIVEWNPAPTNPAQKGGMELVLQSSCARTIGDGAFLDIDDQAITSFIFGLALLGLNNPRIMMMSQNRAFNYKFIILDGNYIKTDYSDAFCGGTIPGINPWERVNYPMWFREGFDNNLYSLFHYINNPRLSGSTSYNYKFTFEFDCLTYQNFSFDKTVSLVMGGQVKYGQVKELSIDFNKRAITVTGIV